MFLSIIFASVEMGNLPKWDAHIPLHYIDTIFKQIKKWLSTNLNTSGKMVTHQKLD